MIEILTCGNIENDFKRLGIKVRETYKGKRFSVHEITKEEFEIMLNEETSAATENWKYCGWRYAEGSNCGEVDTIIEVKFKKLKAWYEKYRCEENYEPRYGTLQEYLCNHLGCSTFRNVAACTVDLAKQNNIKLSELFNKYQGED